MSDTDCMVEWFFIQPTEDSGKGYQEFHVVLYKGSDHPKRLILKAMPDGWLQLNDKDGIPIRWE